MIINAHYPYLSIERDLTWAEIKARAQAGSIPMRPGDYRMDGNLTCWYLGPPTESLSALGNMIFCIDMGTTQWYPGIQNINARWTGCDYARSSSSASYPTFSGIYNSMSADLKAVLNTGTVRYRQVSNSGVVSTWNLAGSQHALTLSDMETYLNVYPLYSTFGNRTFVSADPNYYSVTYKTSTDTTTTEVSYYTYQVNPQGTGGTAGTISYTEVQAPNSDAVTGDTTGDVLLIFGI